MRKHTILYILIAFLVIANGFFLFNYLGKSHHKSRKSNSKNFIVKELQFNDAQTTEYANLREIHKQNVQVTSEAIKNLKNDLFDNISNTNFDAADIDSLTTLIAAKEKEKDIEVFNHFRAVEAICNEQQKEQFKSIIKNAIQKKGNKKRRKKD